MKLKTTILTVSILTFGSLALTGCSGKPAENKVASEPSVQVVEEASNTPVSRNPNNVLKTLADLEGATVNLKEDEGIFIDVPDENVTEWTGEVADSSIARFLPGEIVNGMVQEPAIATLKSGSTAVVITKVTDGETIVFNINVQ